MDNDYRFPSSERLKQKRLFDSLFSEGNKAFAHPLMAVWKPMIIPNGEHMQVGFSVPKKHYKKAVDRNLIKRKLREAYRHQNENLKAVIDQRGIQIGVVFIVLKTDNTSYECLQKKMMVLLREIEQKVVHVS